MIEFVVGAIANMLTRFLPFMFFKRHTNKFLFLKDDFPIVLLTILTLYILFPEKINFNILNYKLISIAFTIITQLIFRRFLLSIFIGSILYIYLVN